jgi:hypothetical protein
MILARTSEGRARAKLREVRFSRKPALSQFQREEALKRLEAGESPVDIGRTFGVLIQQSMNEFRISQSCAGSSVLRSSS